MNLHYTIISDKHKEDIFDGNFRIKLKENPGKFESMVSNRTLKQSDSEFELLESICKDAAVLILASKLDRHPTEEECKSLLKELTSKL